MLDDVAIKYIFDTFGYDLVHDKQYTSDDKDVSRGIWTSRDLFNIQLDINKRQGQKPLENITATDLISFFRDKFISISRFYVIKKSIEDFLKYVEKDKGIKTNRVEIGNIKYSQISDSVAIKPRGYIKDEIKLKDILDVSSEMDKSAVNPCMQASMGCFYYGLTKEQVFSLKREHFDRINKILFNPDTMRVPMSVPNFLFKYIQESFEFDGYDIPTPYTAIDDEYLIKRFIRRPKNNKSIPERKGKDIEYYKRQYNSFAKKVKDFLGKKKNEINDKSVSYLNLQRSGLFYEAYKQGVEGWDGKFNKDFEQFFLRTSYENSFYGRSMYFLYPMYVVYLKQHYKDRVIKMEK